MGGSPPGGSLLPYPRRPDLAETGLQVWQGLMQIQLEQKLKPAGM